MTDKLLGTLSFRVEPNVEDLYGELAPDRKRAVKVMLIEAILRHHAEQQFDVKAYAQEHGVSLQIGKVDED